MTSNEPNRIIWSIPFWSQSNAMNWDSNWNLMSRLLPRMADKRPGWLWLVNWPRDSHGAGNWDWKSESLFEHPKIWPVPYPYETSMRHGVGSGVDRAAIKTIQRRFGPSIYWGHAVEFLPFIFQGMESANSQKSWPTSVAQHHYIVHESLPFERELATFRRKWLQIGGSIVADSVVCNSNHTRQMMDETFRSWISPQRMDAIDENTVVRRFGLVDCDHDYPQLRDHDHPVVLYNHRFQAYKQHRHTAEVLRELRDDGHDFRVWVTQTQGGAMSDFPADRDVGDPDFDQYLENIAVPAINTLNSVHETFCISVLDSMMLGQIPVLPNRVTFPELVPDGYPYLFDNRGEQRAMIAHILDNWESEFSEWSDRLRKWARSEFGIDDYCGWYVDHFDCVADRRKTPMMEKSEWKNDAFRALIEQIDGRVSVPKFHRVTSREMELGTPAWPPNRMIRACGQIGCEFESNGKKAFIVPP